MKHWKFGRGTSVLAILVVLLATMAPFTTLAADHEATRTQATFVVSNGPPIDEGTFWQDASGGIHIRNLVTADELTGDISGTSASTQNVDVLAIEGCEGGEECLIGVNVWGTLDIEGEAGGWEGRFVEAISFRPDDMYDLGFVDLTGTGAYANMSFFGRVVETTDETSTIEGFIYTMATPKQSLNLSATLCAGDVSWSGSYLSTGVIDGSGAATGNFLTVSSEYASDSNIYGSVEVADAGGTATLEFVGGGREILSPDTFTSHGFGTFIITGGTGAYADLYGLGRVTGTATAMPGCASGFGVHVQFIGEAQMN